MHFYHEQDLRHVSNTHFSRLTKMDPSELIMLSTEYGINLLSRILIMNY